MSSYARSYATTTQAYGYQNPVYGQDQQAAQAAYYQQYYQSQQPQQPQPFPSYNAGSTPGPGYAALHAQSAQRPTTPHPAQPVKRRHTSAEHRAQPARHASSSAGHHRTASHSQQHGAPPLRSAMKKSTSKPGHGHNSSYSQPLQPAQEIAAQNLPTLLRARTRSGGTERPRMDSTRSRTGSSTAAAARFAAIPSTLAHLFVTIKAPSVLEVHNITSDALHATLAYVCKAHWRKAHVEPTQYAMRAKFVGRPFAGSGPDLVEAQKMLIALFTALAGHGYLALTAVHTNAGNTAPRLVFQRDVQDPACVFFSMCMDPTGVTFVGAPKPLVENLTLHLNGHFRKSFVDEVNADASYSIRRREDAPSLGTGTSLNSADGRSLVFSVILKYLNDEYYKLDASIAFGRTGLFGFGPRREAWIFKTSPRWRAATQ